MGPSKHTEERARWLAGLGYVGLAADIFGKGVRPKNRDEAGKAAGPYFQDRKKLRERALAGIDALKKHELVDAARLGAIGFCFGGTTALEIARSGADVAAVVSFHGALQTPNPADAKTLKSKILVLHGVDDPMIPPDHVTAFWKEMQETKADWHFVGYGNAMHAFTNKEANDRDFGTVYEKRADTRSWEHMKFFFKEAFGV